MQLLLDPKSYGLVISNDMGGWSWMMNRYKFEVYGHNITAGTIQVTATGTDKNHEIHSEKSISQIIFIPAMF